MGNRYIYMAVYAVMIAIPAMAALTAVMGPLVPVPLVYLAADGAVAGLLLAILYLFLRQTVKFIASPAMPPLQRNINYGALGLLFILIWVGLQTVMFFVMFPKQTAQLFLPTIPLRVLIAMLLYYIVVISSQRDELKSRVSNEDMPEEDFLPEIKVANCIRSEDSAQIDKGFIESDKQDSVHPYTKEIIGHIAVRNGQKIDLIMIPDIMAIIAEGDYVMIHTGKGKYMKEQTMTYFVNHLPLNKFVRVHRSGIVNIDYLTRIETYEKQNQIITLSNNLKVKASAAGYKELKKMLNL